MRECIGENEEIEDLINIVLNKTNISFKLNRLQIIIYHFSNVFVKTIFGWRKKLK